MSATPPANADGLWAAAESIVLLKNEGGILPLKHSKKIALIGDFSLTPRYQGAGSSMVNPTKVDSLKDAMEAAELDMVGYCAGYERSGKPNLNILFQYNMPLRGLAQMTGGIIGECINFPIQRNFVFRSKGNLAKQIGWYLLAFCIITCIVNSINCIWVAVAGLLVPDFIYNIGTTVLNGGISMVIFFFVNKIIFPEGEAKKEN